METTRAEHARKTVTGGAMVVAPLFMLAGDILWPGHGTDAKKMVGQFASHPNRGLISTYAYALGMLLAVGAVIGLAHLLHERRPGLAVAGSAVSLAGIVAAAGTTATFGTVLYEMNRGTRDLAQMQSLLRGIMRGAMLPFEIGSILLGVGLVVMAVGLVRAHVVSPASAVALGIGAVALAVGYASGLKVASVAADIVLFAGLGSIGFTVLAETDAEWAHTPEFHGFGRGAVASTA